MSTRPAEPARRRYDNTLRSEQAAGTRQRIVDAACELARESGMRDWRGLTVTATAERAGVSARTVYRHFTSEVGLRQAAMAEMEQRAGIDLSTLSLDGVADAAARIFSEVGGFRTAPAAEADPVLAEAGARQREALVAAVAEVADGWTDEERIRAAAVLDVLWSPAAYERLLGNWGLGPDGASEALTWAVRLVIGAVRGNRQPVDFTTSS
ncbi:TetR/AcrR family transcriptional regulator [Dermatobacter hominis]|uniref:TetR/AcrR family transcriptional regulator n=1 Tax=Dermatobacter hominis TaxID=2884263 RepID=UPI001D118BE5|nr:helix-turn-helix domain-containing protein [Dermatobacter hominis]UDY36710.1 TetR/AcrR family transcriptional regulator [Dermatobacter hominis]